MLARPFFQSLDTFLNHHFFATLLLAPQKSLLTTDVTQMNRAY